MSKVLVENPADNTVVPFLRGILVHSLQDAGVGFDDAHRIATEIRAELNGSERITTVELEQRVFDKLELLNGQEYKLRYEVRGVPSVIQVEGRDGQLTEFSRTEYRNNLEAIGLRYGEAQEIVHAVLAHLIKRKSGKVTSRYIAYFTYRLLRKSLGQAVARRWLIWRDFMDSGRPLVILLGGTAGSGKSTVAADLASRLDIVRTTSTDMLREVMRSIISQKMQPVLHESSFIAWTALPKSRKAEADPDELLVEGYTHQADIVSTAVDAVIQRAAREGVSLVVEGIHIHPSSIEDLARINHAVVVPVMLAVLKPKTLKRRIMGRSTEVPQRKAEHYLNYFESIWRLQSHLLSEADQAGVPIVVNADREDVLREIMLITIEELAKDFNKTPEQVFG